MISRRNLLGTAAAGAALAALPIRLDAKPQRDTLVRLDANENPYGPSPAARKAMQAAIADGNRYAGDPELRDLRTAIAKRERVTPDHILLGAGSTEILVAAGLAFLRNGETLLTSERTFGLLPAYAGRLGARVEQVPVTEAQALDLAAIGKKLGQGEKLVYVCNPNNPTGTLAEPTALRAFCDAAAKTSTVLVDEAYLEYLEPAQQQSMVELVREGRDVIVSRTFSKIYGLAGMRIGYAVAKPELISRLGSLKPGVVNNVAVAAAMASLGDTEFVTTSRRRNAETRAAVVSGLRKRGFASAESHTNFVWFRIGEKTDLPQRLASRGILLPASRTALQGGWARVTVGRPAEIEAFLTSLDAVT